MCYKVFQPVCIVPAPCCYTVPVILWVIHVVSRAHFFSFFFFLFPSNFWEHSACYDKGDDLQENKMVFISTPFWQIRLQTLCLEFNRKIKKKEKEKVYSINGWCSFWYAVCIVCVGSHATRSDLKQNKPVHAITASILPLFSFPLFHSLSLSAPLFFTHFLWLCNLLLKAAGYFPSFSLRFWISLFLTHTHLHMYGQKFILSYPFWRIIMFISVMNNRKGQYVQYTVFRYRMINLLYKYTGMVIKVLSKCKKSLTKDSVSYSNDIIHLSDL